MDPCDGPKCPSYLGKAYLLENIENPCEVAVKLALSGLYILGQYNHYPQTNGM